jgi:L-asparaginase
VPTTVITTGGTIGWHAGEGRMLTGSELVEAAGARADEIIDAYAVPSWDLSIDDMVEVARLVRRTVEAGATCVTVTHGTDTLEETAWLTELMLGAQLRRRAAILFTGAMRASGAEDSDGPSNLTLALSAGRRPELVGAGVQVAWGKKLYPARSVHKVDAHSSVPFEGELLSGGRCEPPEPGSDVETRVALVKASPVGRGALPSDVPGVVLEGTGTSHVPSSYRPAIEGLLAAGVPVVIASRCRDRASGTDLGHGALPAADLTAEKAAIALMVGIGRHRLLDDLRPWWSDLVKAGE